jgi:serine/threonine-protein kinase
MDPDWHRRDRLLEEALAQPPAGRAAFLDHACAGDATLRESLHRLLAAAESEDGFLEAPAAEVAGGLVAEWAGEHGDGAAPGTPLEGRRVGAYRLLDRLGEGGMGTVYLAERADGQFEHRVALKLVRAGLASDDLRRRFRRERQILARLSHPHIARLLDGGVTGGPGGEELPYLVMELVEGEPLTAYAERHRLPVEARLGLFAQVCEAVAYAHRMLVVHRDLKPSNVLVTEDEAGHPHVKLLDFGIARLLGDDDGGAGEAGTRTLLPALTPEYAAPEQVRGEPVTTATDVYSLGVVLYELLTGQRPYAFTRHTPAEVERVVCEEEPERPSAVVTPASERGSPGRPIASEALRRRLAGDLDAVVLKALRKEPAARYTTADALLEDVQRHLGGLPVSAHAPTLGYRVGKFVRRHRWGAAAAAAFTLLLLGATTVTAVQSRRIRHQAEALAVERDRARGEAEKATRVTDFLLSLFEANDPEVARGDTLTAGDLMARGLREADALRHQPDVQAEMLEVIGRTYQSMGRPDLAVVPLERALSLQRRLHPGPHPDLARSLSLTGMVVGELEGYSRAESLLREALTMQRGLLGPDDPYLGATLYSLAGVLHFQGRQGEADTLFEEAVRIFRQLPGTPDPEAMRPLADIATYLLYSRSYADAEALYRRLIPMQEAYYGETNPALATTRLELGQLLNLTHRYRESERVIEEALEAATPLGEDHFVVQMGRRELAIALYAQGRYAEAEHVLRQTLGAGPLQDENNEASILLYLGLVLLEQGRLGEAEGPLREHLRLREQVLGAGSVYAGDALVALGRLERLRGDYEAATAHLARARAIYAASLQPGHPRQAEVLLELGHVEVMTGAFAEAEPLLRESLAIQEQNAPPQPYRLAVTRRLLGVALTHLGRYGEAEPLLRASLRTAEALERPDLAEPARQALRDLATARSRPAR